jgi:hypothetical protein
MLATGKIQLGVASIFTLGAILWFGQGLLSRGQGPVMQGPPPATTLPWRSDKPFKEAGYVGGEACAECHVREFKSYHDAAMARALQTAADSLILKSHARLTFRVGPYSYEIIRDGDRSIYSVSDGKRSIAVPILYSFGQGKAGQTYVLEYKGAFYESRVSYYRALDGLDFTIGYPRTVPSSLEEALGRAISLDETLSCFGCHATASSFGKRLQLEQMIPGVSCEACHGPGRDHIAAMEAGREETRIFNPGKMSPDELSQEFCGSCHRSVEQVLNMPQQGGINNVRFQPYRLFTSRGHDPTDPRLSCIACHNPHEHLKEDVAYYDAKCLACHQTKAELSPAARKVALAKDRTAKACPISDRNCVTCHMPKVDLPGAHLKFTDHRIRIARPGEPYPN